MKNQNQLLETRWLRIPEAAAYACVSESKLAKDRLLGTGIPFVRNGRVVLYDRNDIDEFLATRKNKSTSEADNSAYR